MVMLACQCMAMTTSPLSRQQHMHTRLASRAAHPVFQCTRQLHKTFTAGSSSASALLPRC